MTTTDEALDRAARIINWMAPAIGQLAPPDGGIKDLNEHWLHMEDLTRKRARIEDPSWQRSPCVLIFPVRGHCETCNEAFER